MMNTWLPSSSLRGVFGLVLSSACLLTGCHSAEKPKTKASQTVAPGATAAPAPVPPSPYLASFSWPEGAFFDFGEITEGAVIEHTYTFVNNGQAPLIVSNVSASCGCTVPTWPRDSIPIGGRGEIVVKFNSKGRKGTQNKRITITANIQGASTALSLRGVVN